MNQKAMLQIQRMQQEMARIQQEIAASEVTGSAGGGMVVVTMTGSGDVRAVAISPAAVDPDDVEMLQDLVVAAITDAKRASEALTQEKMGPLAAGLGGLGIPGL